MSWQIDDALFVCDTLFMPDYGTARCDFPGGSAAQLFDSIQRIYALPERTRLPMCHDYQPGGRELRFVATVGEQKRSNVQLNERTTKEEYLALRKTRDAQLEMPTLILPAVQMNIRAGEFPEPEANGTAYLKIPLNVF
jgi:glyoxylase-like metal-dependent hydrolase (beta-lactamase superfamily II)